MERFKELKKYLYLIGGLLLLVIFVFIYFNNEDDSIILDNTLSEVSDDVNTTTLITDNKIFIDIKGAVKKPGVYELSSEDKVIDAINKAGGLKSNADTSNINLSKKLTNEMVVYIFNKNELKTTTKNATSSTIITTKKSTTSTTKISDNTCHCETIEINNCINKEDNTSSNEDDSKININTATKDELMTLNGIGDAKATAIIEYREKNGLFSSIEDIINVTGISETMYDKIKDNIKV